MATTSYAFTVTSPGTAHTKGSYVEIVASTPHASSRVSLAAFLATGTSRFLLIDLATGAAAAETVVVANLAIHVPSTTVVGEAVSLTLDIPAGTRLAARCQGAGTGTTLTMVLHLEDRALGSLATPETYGIVSASSRGTLVDPGGVASTKSAYVELTASTAARIDALLVVVSPSVQAEAFTVAHTWTVDVAVGAAASEVIVIPDLTCLAEGTDDHPSPARQRLGVAIPAGSRIAVRVACNQTVSPDRILAVSVIGMQEAASSSSTAAGAVAYIG